MKYSMSGLHFAILSVFATAFLRLAIKYCAHSGIRPWSSLAFYYLGAVLLLLPFLGIPDFSTVTQAQWMLIGISGLSFTIAGGLDIRSYETLDASSGEIFGTLTFVLCLAAGFLIFDEHLSLLKGLGVAVVIAGILYESRSTVLAKGRGCWFKLGSCMFTAFGILLTKKLSGEVSSNLLILLGFFIPGAISAVVGFKGLPEIVVAVKKSRGILLSVPALDAAAYAFSVKAFSLGALSTSYLIFQTTIGVVFFFELLIYGWKNTSSSRAIASVLCVIGAMVAISA